MVKSSNIVIGNTFLYFAYGSNLFAFRMRMNCKSAEFVSIARLDNYRLSFINYSKFWGGPTVTAVPTANAHTWGVVWRIDIEDREALDMQYDIEKKKYYIKYIPVLTPHMGELRCLTYIQRVSPLPRADNDAIPIERWPSWSYKTVIIQGAEEHFLPEYYIKGLKKIQDNGDEGCFRTACLLIRYGTEQPCECRVPLKIDLKMLREKK